jgi:hypothetical protein
MQSKINMAARKHVAGLVVNGARKELDAGNAWKQGLGIILSLVDTLNNDIMIEQINIFSSLCYSELLSG